MLNKVFCKGYFSCQLISLFFKKQGFWCMHAKEPFTCIVPTFAVFLLHDSTKSQEDRILMYLTSCVNFTLQNIESF
jgi:hypothetical protein